MAMTNDEKIEATMKEAAQYAARGMEHLIADNPDNQERMSGLLNDYAKLANGLEVHFLFPNLSDWERSLLGELLEARRGMYAAMKAENNLRSPEHQEHHDKVNADFQTRYVNARAEVTNPTTLAKMTGLQQSILEKEFFSLPMIKKETGQPFGRKET
jgi:hypothetical protein